VSARYKCFAESYPEHELTMLEFGPTSSEYAWVPLDDIVPYRRLTLFDGPVEQQSRRRIRTAISGALEDLDPDVLVVCGYGVTGMGAVLQWAQRRWSDVAVVMLSDSTAADRARKQWKEWVKRRVIGRCGSALVAGTRQSEYMLSLGMPRDKIWEGYDVVDNDFFWNSVQSARAKLTPRELGLPQNYFLTCVRFLRRKNLLRLVQAYWRYASCCSETPWKLVIVGDGELRSELKKQIDALGVSEGVMLAGFKQYGELPQYYAFAGAFILASMMDPWGLVVNEAMACGLPVLVSERCGCATDLVKPGENGLTFNPEDVEQLAGLMLHVSSSNCDRGKMGQASREIVSRWTLRTFAQGLAQAIVASVERPKSAPSLTDKIILSGLSRR
jgi:glycosyltransferase involved in cell wall biosynthesis